MIAFLRKKNKENMLPPEPQVVADKSFLRSLLPDMQKINSMSKLKFKSDVIMLLQKYIDKSEN